MLRVLLEILEPLVVLLELSAHKVFKVLKELKA